MEAKQYLENIRFMMNEKAMWEDELGKIDDMIIGAPAIQYDSDKITSSPRKDGLEMLAINHLERREDIIRQINNLITELIEKRDEALRYITLIKSKDQQEVLIMYYVNALSWREIADIRERYNLAGQMRLRDRAISTLQKIFDDMAI